MFDLPLITDRQRLRAPVMSDLDTLVARRNDPASARFQSWPVPYPADRGEQLLSSVSAMSGPKPGEWWMLTVTDPDDLVVFGDIALHVNETSTAAEIGYTFDPMHRGRGLATEAAGAVIAALWSCYPELRRVQATMHPGNHASARVVERLGFVAEGQTRLSYYRDDRPVGGDEHSSDDLIYGLTRQDWDQWQARPVDRPERVELVEITADNQRAVRALSVHRSQAHLVAPVLESLADAGFPPLIDGHRVKPWMRAAYADGEPVGFVLMAEPDPVRPEPYLWRLLVDRRHQGRGIGAQVMADLVKQCRTWGHDRLLLSWVPGAGSAEPFYRRLGFEPTGTIEHGEVEARLWF